MRIETLINKYSDRLNDTDIIIWKYIVKHKKECCDFTIYELASACNVSRTTVMRFAQKLSLRGYSELKALLNLESKHVDNTDISNLDDIRKLYNHVIDETIRKSFTRINQMLYKAKHIFAYGTGIMQNNVVNELRRLFNNSGDFVINVGGPAEFSFLLNNVTKEDVVIIVSFSGETIQTIEFAKRLKMLDVPIISITKLRDNTLAALSDENMYIPTLDFQLYPNFQDYKIESTAGYFIAIEILFLEYQIYKREKGLVAEHVTEQDT